MLKVSGLETFYGKSQALFGVDLEVGTGEVVTLLGRNGMGSRCGQNRYEYRDDIRCTWSVGFKFIRYVMETARCSDIEWKRRALFKRRIAPEHNVYGKCNFNSAGQLCLFHH